VRHTCNESDSQTSGVGSITALSLRMKDDGDNRQSFMCVFLTISYMKTEDNEFSLQLHLTLLTNYEMLSFFLLFILRACNLN
jgi:hypothetical protein